MKESKLGDREERYRAGCYSEQLISAAVDPQETMQGTASFATPLVLRGARLGQQTGAGRLST